jgi:hypothetical protein
MAFQSSKGFFTKLLQKSGLLKIEIQGETKKKGSDV